MAKKRKKQWSKLVEEAGVRILLYERANSSSVWYSFTRPDGSKVRKSLKTTSRDTATENAKALAKELAEAKLTGRDTQSLTIGQLFGAYFRDRAPTLSDRWRKSAETRRTLFEGAWGPSKLVGDIGQSDVDRFTERRMSGEVTAEGTLVVDGVRAGTVEADLRWLSTVFRWARGVKVNGRPLILSNPMEGLRRPAEQNVRRPVASHQRFTATMERADLVDPDGRLRCMLTLARYTGRREGSICGLRADDILRDPHAVRAVLAGMGLDETAAEHFPNGGIRWRGETDKKGYESVTPLSRPAREEIDRYLEKSPRLGAVPLFPAPSATVKGSEAEEPREAPMRIDTAGKWLLRAEKKAKLPKLAGGRWHPYRRLFATELRALPVHDVAAAGGWWSVETVQRIYQRAEAEGVLSAIQAIGGASGS